MKWDAEMYDVNGSQQTNAGIELAAMAAIGSDDSVLDIGCGTGRLTLELARLAHAGKVVGIDPSFEMIQKAREASLPYDNVFLLQIPAERMEFRGEFDLVYSNSSFQWIKQQEDVVARSYKALRKEGRIAVQTPAKDYCWALTETFNSAISSLGMERRFSKMGSPWRFPLKGEFAGFLKDAGFMNIKTFYKDYELVFKSVNDVLGWTEASALRPYLSLLDRKKQERFKYAFAMGFENYRTDRGIVLGFKRLFAYGEK